MAPPLQNVPDCQGEQYRLQLNIYKWILETYYELRIGSMYVVCVHPAYAPTDFLDEVPDMTSTVSILMQVVRDQVQPPYSPSKNEVLADTPHQRQGDVGISRTLILLLYHYDRMGGPPSIYPWPEGLPT